MEKGRGGDGVVVMNLKQNVEQPGEENEEQDGAYHTYHPGRESVEVYTYFPVLNQGQI